MHEYIKNKLPGYGKITGHWNFKITGWLTDKFHSSRNFRKHNNFLGVTFLVTIILHPQISWYPSKSKLVLVCIILQQCILLVAFPRNGRKLRPLNLPLSCTYSYTSLVIYIQKTSYLIMAILVSCYYRNCVTYPSDYFV